MQVPASRSLINPEATSNISLAHFLLQGTACVTNKLSGKAARMGRWARRVVRESDIKEVQSVS